VGVKYWKIIADNLSKAWLHVGLHLRRSLQPATQPALLMRTATTESVSLCVLYGVRPFIDGALSLSPEKLLSQL
jgi:hypothetical protein